jgi:hypothetical protein
MIIFLLLERRQNFCSMFAKESGIWSGKCGVSQPEMRRRVAQRKYRAYKNQMNVLLYQSS